MTLEDFPTQWNNLSLDNAKNTSPEFKEVALGSTRRVCTYRRPNVPRKRGIKSEGREGGGEGRRGRSGEEWGGVGRRGREEEREEREGGGEGGEGGRRRGRRGREEEREEREGGGEGGVGREEEREGGGGEGEEKKEMIYVSEHMHMFPLPLICSSMMGCEVLYSTHADGLGLAVWSSMGEPSSCFMVTVLRNLTVEKSTLAARPAMADGAKFFFPACARACTHSHSAQSIQCKHGSHLSCCSSTAQVCAHGSHLSCRSSTAHMAAICPATAHMALRPLPQTPTATSSYSPKRATIASRYNKLNLSLYRAWPMMGYGVDCVWLIAASGFIST